MDCRAFEVWVDVGRPPEGRAGAEAHFAACSSCRELQETAQAIEAGLAQRFATAPLSFADDVMARLPAPASIPSAPEIEMTTPWWLSALTEPVVLLSLAACALLAGSADTLWSLASRALPRVAAWYTMIASSESLPLTPPALTILTALLPLLGAGAFLLYRWVESLGTGVRTLR
jgi:hypothetical protein